MTGASGEDMGTSTVVGHACSRSRFLCVVTRYRSVCALMGVRCVLGVRVPASEKNRSSAGSVGRLGYWCARTGHSVSGPSGDDGLAVERLRTDALEAGRRSGRAVWSVRHRFWAWFFPATLRGRSTPSLSWENAPWSADHTNWACKFSEAEK